MIPLIVLIQVEMMRNFSAIQKASPQLFTQYELNHVIRDLGFSKEKAELLGSRLKEKKFVGSWDIYVLLQKQGTGVYKRFFTGW
jgi:hypothetical protein